MLNLLSGFNNPQSGQISINQTAVRPERSELGYVFQAPQLFPWLSALENVRFGLRMTAQLNEDQQRARRRCSTCVWSVWKARRNAHIELSGHAAARLLARTLALEPSVLLMDDTFAALDAIGATA